MRARSSLVSPRQLAFSLSCPLPRSRTSTLLLGSLARGPRLARRLRPERKQLFPETSPPSTLPTSSHALSPAEQPGPVGWGAGRWRSFKKKKKERKVKQLVSGPRVAGLGLRTFPQAAERPRPVVGTPARSYWARSRARERVGSWGAGSGGGCWGGPEAAAAAGGGAAAAAAAFTLVR